MRQFACSVVVPSCGRAAKLDLLLAALAAQDTDEPFEVIVVLDGATDESRDVIETWEKVGVFESLRWTEQERQGQATARNTGSFLARAPILVFLDDDCIPEPDLIGIHLAHHRSGERIAVLGDCEIVRTQPGSLLENSIWMWWEDTNHRRAALGQPPSYRDFCTGNLSVRRDDFARLGGFDQDFTGYGREDYELGYRFLRSGVRFVADRRARARHLATATVKGRAEAARQEAHGDVLIARKHPELTAGLRFMSCEGRRTRMAAGLGMHAPRLGAALVFFLRGVVAARSTLHLRRRWRSGVDFIWEFSYWRGLHDAVGSMDGVRALRHVAPSRPVQQVNLALPLPPQVARLDIDVPSSLDIRFEDKLVGRLDLKPNMDEPVLEWLTREVSKRLAIPVLTVKGRLAIEGDGAPSDPVFRMLPGL